MTSRRDFLRRGALWLAAAPTVAEALDRLAWQERRIFALGELPKPPACETIGWMEVWGGSPGAAHATLLATVPLTQGASGIVDLTGYADRVVYRIPPDPNAPDLLRQVGFTHTGPAECVLSQRALVAGQHLTLTSSRFA